MPERRNLIRNQFSRTKTGSQPATKDQEAPTRAAVWQAENEPVIDGGNLPRPIRHFRLAERCTPDLSNESGPRSFGVGSKIGYHHHQLRRPAFRFDARTKLQNSARGVGVNSWNSACQRAVVGSWSL